MWRSFSLRRFDLSLWSGAFPSDMKLEGPWNWDSASRPGSTSFRDLGSITGVFSGVPSRTSIPGWEASGVLVRSEGWVSSSDLKVWLLKYSFEFSLRASSSLWSRVISCCRALFCVLASCDKRWNSAWEGLQESEPRSVSGRPTKQLTLRVFPYENIRSLLHELHNFRTSASRCRSPANPRQHFDSTSILTRCALTGTFRRRQKSQAPELRCLRLWDCVEEETFGIMKDVSGFGSAGRWSPVSAKQSLFWSGRPFRFRWVSG